MADLQFYAGGEPVPSLFTRTEPLPNRSFENSTPGTLRMTSARRTVRARLEESLAFTAAVHAQQKHAGLWLATIPPCGRSAKVCYPG